MAMVCVEASGQSLLVGFEDLSLTGAGVESYDGPGGGVYNAGLAGTGGFASNGVTFGNTYTDWGGGAFSWTGWAYSTTTDVETGGYGNQFSAFPMGAHGGQVYALSYAPSELALPSGWGSPQSVWVANTTYAGISMRDGDSFARKFTAGDFFKLVLTGYDDGGGILGTLEVFLADFRAGLETGFILDTWQEVDLSALGTNVATIGFSLESTDVGDWGINTPSFFAIDDLTLAPTIVPEPAGWGLMAGLGGLILVMRRRRSMLGRHVD